MATEGDAFLAEGSEPRHIGDRRCKGRLRLGKGHPGEQLDRYLQPKGIASAVSRIIQYNYVRTIA
jgi:hypothetical protein